MGCPRCRLPQEAPPYDRRHGQEPLDVLQAENFRAGIEVNIPCLNGFWSHALHQAPARSLQSIRRSLPTTSHCTYPSSRHSPTNSRSSSARPIAIGYAARQTLLPPLTATSPHDRFTFIDFGSVK